MKTQTPIAREVWFTFGQGLRNQITVHSANASTDAEAIAHAREYMTTEESATARDIEVKPVYL